LDIVQAAISSFITITLIVMLGVGVMKLFQIGNELNEVKSLLKDIRRNGEELLPAGRAPAHVLVPAQMRDMSAEEYAAALQPEIVTSPQSK
jgi:hypothetical protein